MRKASTSEVELFTNRQMRPSEAERYKKYLLRARLQDVENELYAEYRKMRHYAALTPGHRRRQCSCEHCLQREVHHNSIGCLQSRKRTLLRQLGERIMHCPVKGCTRMTKYTKEHGFAYHGLYQHMKTVHPGVPMPKRKRECGRTKYWRAAGGEECEGI